MQVARQSGISVAVSSMAVVGVLLFTNRLAGGTLTRDTMVETFILMVSIGAIVGMSCSNWLGKFKTELRLFATHVNALAHGRDDLTRYHPHHDLEEISVIVDSALSSLRNRVDMLVAQRREMEVQIRLAEVNRNNAESVLNAIHDAVVVTDAFNEVSIVNLAAAKLFDFELAEVIHRPVDEIVSDVTLLRAIKETREAGLLAVRRKMELRLECCGEEGVFDVTIAAMAKYRNSQLPPEASGVVTILKDITREREISEMKSSFVSNVSHELKTPLSSIKAYMEMLIDGEAEDEQTQVEFYNIIQSETNRLQRLIDNILDINRIEHGVVKVQREQIQLPVIIREVVDVMLPQARAKNIELIDASEPIYLPVFADHDMIYQATLNLIGNAIKYTLAKGIVTVSINFDEQGQMVSVLVKDSGVGIPESDLPHLFDKFYRVSNHKKLASGTGLGLNLVKQIIETVHGGVVEVKSELGQGSEFKYSLPIAGKIRVY